MDKCKIDLCIQNIWIYSTIFQKFIFADVYIADEKIYYIDTKQERNMDVVDIIDGHGMYMAPGLIDIHMHIESSMMTPSSIAKRLAECGVTTIVSEPHEIANVNGLQGVKDMMDAGDSSLIDIYYGIPSCVPSTNSTLETTGGVVEFEDMKELLHHPKVACIGEVMNYRQVIEKNDFAIGKLLEYLSQKEPRYIIEGHCPSLMDQDLAKFVYLGIDSDHTEHSIEELKQRFLNGMYVEIQDKMMKEEVLSFIEKNNLYGHFGFVSDDVMADTLMNNGHLDAIVRKAIQMGMPVEKAIYHATYTNAVRMNFVDRTMLTPGKLADFILLDNLQTFHIVATYKNGKCIFDLKNKENTIHIEKQKFPEEYYHSIQISKIDKNVLCVHIEDDIDQVVVNVMEVNDGSTKTKAIKATLPVVNREIQWENSPYLLAVVFDRYGKTSNIGYGFVTKDCIKKGAVATSFAHDHHNLLAIGSNKNDLRMAINRVIEMQGGICVVENEKEKASLLLNVGGIISDAPAVEIGNDLMKVRESLIELGYQHYNPIMSLCTLSLLASPSLKISDQGLVDVAQGKVIPINL